MKDQLDSTLQKIDHHLNEFQKLHIRSITAGAAAIGIAVAGLISGGSSTINLFGIGLHLPVFLASTVLMSGMAILGWMARSHYQLVGQFIQDTLVPLLNSNSQFNQPANKLRLIAENADGKLTKTDMKKAEMLQTADNHDLALSTATRLEILLTSVQLYRFISFPVRFANTVLFSLLNLLAVFYLLPGYVNWILPTSGIKYIVVFVHGGAIGLLALVLFYPYPLKKFEKQGQIMALYESETDNL